jgi:hypothetical protein
MRPPSVLLLDFDGGRDHPYGSWTQAASSMRAYAPPFAVMAA